jgi:hypothetical protein
MALVNRYRFGCPRRVLFAPESDLIADIRISSFMPTPTQHEASRLYAMAYQATNRLSDSFGVAAIIELSVRSPKNRHSNQCGNKTLHAEITARPGGGSHYLRARKETVPMRADSVRRGSLCTRSSVVPASFGDLDADAA